MIPRLVPVNAQRWWLRRTGFSRPKRALYYRRLAAFIRDGVPLYDALERLRERYAHTGDPRMRILDLWLQELRRGRPLADALSGWAPPEEVVLIGAAERGGRLAEGLEITAGMADSMGRIVNAITGAVTYPAVIFLALMGLVVFFAASLVPQLAESLPPEQWTGDAATVHLLSQVVTGYWAVLILSVVTPITLIAATLGTWTGTVRGWVDRWLPPWNLYRAYQSAAVLAALSAMTTAGIPVLDAVIAIRDQGSPWVRRHLSRAVRRLRAGLSPGQALTLPLFDRETADDIHVYGASGSFETMLAGIGDRVVDATVRQAGRIARVVNGILLLVGGLAIGWIYLSIYSLTQTVAAG